MTRPPVVSLWLRWWKVPDAHKRKDEMNGRFACELCVYVCDWTDHWFPNARWEWPPQWALLLDVSSGVTGTPFRLARSRSPDLSKLVGG